MKKIKKIIYIIISILLTLVSTGLVMIVFTMLWPAAFKSATGLNFEDLKTQSYEQETLLKTTIDLTKNHVIPFSSISTIYNHNTDGYLSGIIYKIQGDSSLFILTEDEDFILPTDKWEISFAALIDPNKYQNIPFFSLPDNIQNIKEFDDPQTKILYVLKNRTVPRVIFFITIIVSFFVLLLTLGCWINVFSRKNV